MSIITDAAKSGFHTCLEQERPTTSSCWRTWPTKGNPGEVRIDKKMAFLILNIYKNVRFHTWDYTYHNLPCIRPVCINAVAYNEEERPGSVILLQVLQPYAFQTQAAHNSVARRGTHRQSEGKRIVLTNA